MTETILIQEKTCSFCGLLRHADEFRRRKDGYRDSQCKSCISAKRKEYRIAHKEEIAQKHKEYRAKNIGKLSAYHKEWYGDNRERIIKKSHDRFISKREDIRIASKAYRDNNKEKIRDADKKWRANNKDKKKQTDDLWRKNNRERVNERARKYIREKIDSNPKFKLNTNFSCLIRRSLKHRKNGRHWPELVGYSLDQLKKHLEKRFTGEMSWANHGSYWHIDHIIPISAFNYTSYEDIDFKRCWALKNLRPLEAISNIKKSNKIERPFQPSLELRIFNKVTG